MGGCADRPPLLRGSVHPISVLKLTKNEVVGGSRHWPVMNILEFGSAR